MESGCLEVKVILGCMFVCFEFEASLGYLRPRLKGKTKTEQIRSGKEFQVSETERLSLPTLVTLQC